MAILKDLIVHGSSRFLNKIYADELETSAFEAESAVIKKLKADDATVVGLLDVQGQLHTNTWTNSNIATIDGCFYITPTISSDSGNIVFLSVNVASLTGNFAAVNSLYIGDSSSGSTVQWTSGSNVLLTGEVKINNQWVPLGTLLGTLSANAGTSSIGLKELKDNRHNDSAIIIDIRNAIGSTSVEYRNLKISLYQRKDGTDSKPLGIYMTAMGTNGKTFIDIYGGVNATTTAGSSGGFADPNLRIGNLSGLGAVEGTTPTGWGIYTTNGYFKGVIVSSAGKIGGFDIGTSSIKNTKTSYSETTNNGVWVGTDGIGLGKGLFYVTNAGALTAKSGSIAGWSFNASSLYKTNATPGYNASTMVISTGTASTNNIGGGGTASKTWMISAGTGFGVTTAGALYCNDAHISGEITATSGTIGGASITGGTLTVPAAQVSGKLTAATIDGTQITANTITADQIATGAIKTDELDANAVTSVKIKAGEVKATNIDSGAVTAEKISVENLSAISASMGTLTSGTISYGTVGSNSSFYLSSSDTSATIAGASRTGLRLTVGSKFGVSNTGALYATSATISGAIVATSLTAGTKTSATVGKGVYINASGAIYVGNGSTNNFTVTDTGTITATGANLLTATIGNATNKITIGTGTSGHSSIRYGMTTLADTTNNGFYIGTDGIALGKGAFKVTAAGVLNATEATISGNITATSGTIGGASISDGILQITNTNISGTISANHIDASSLSIGISQVSNLQSTLDGKASTSAVTTAAGTASKYISVIDQNGITVHAENNSTLNYTKISSQAIIMYQNGNDVMNLKTNQFRIGTNAGNNIKIDANGITINNGSTQVASYKDSIILGDEANNNLLFLDKSSLSLRSGAEDYLSGNEVFEVGECAETISKTVTSGQASYQWSELANNTKEMKEVTLSGVLLEEGVDYTFNSTTGTVTLTNAPTNSTSKLKVSFIPINPEAIQKTITFTTPEEEYWLLRSFYSIPQHVTNIFSVSLNGTVLTSSQYSYNSSTHILKIPATPTESNAPAAGSTVEVVYTKSLGYYYTLGKRDLTKIGDYSIATGYNCMAAGDKSFAGGNYTYVTGQSSFGYGYGTNDADCVQIPGNYCGGIGRGIIVRGTGNFGCGNYNVPSSSYIFSVGNGSSSTDRKNAFYVAKSGNARVAGTLTVMNGIQIAGQIRHYKTDGSGTVPLFWYDTKRKSNISVPANNTNTGLTCDITLPNRIPMGIVGMRILNSSSNGANASNCNLYIYMIVHNSSEDHVTFSIKNSASSAAKVDVEFKIFYIANEALNNQIEWT